MIFAAACNYGFDTVKPFLKSLYATGYDDKVVMAVIPLRNRIPEFFEGHHIEFIPLPSTSLPVHSARLIAFQQYLKNNPTDEQVIHTDVRDVIFQTNPATHLPSTGLHVYCEHEGMTIGKCPYNSKWIREGYGEEVLAELEALPIICSGFTVGNGASMQVYFDTLIQEVSEHASVQGYEQGPHNGMVRRGVVQVTVHDNKGEVFTVGYVPKGSIRFEDGLVRNDFGVPCIVHQYDRHPNLKSAILGKYV